MCPHQGLLPPGGGSARAPFQPEEVQRGAPLSPHQFGPARGQADRNTVKCRAGLIGKRNPQLLELKRKARVVGAEGRQGRKHASPPTQGGLRELGLSLLHKTRPREVTAAGGAPRACVQGVGNLTQGVKTQRRHHQVGIWSQKAHTPDLVEKFLKLQN